MAIIFYSLGAHPLLNKIKASDGCHQFLTENDRASRDKIWAQTCLTPNFPSFFISSETFSFTLRSNVNNPLSSRKLLVIDQIRVY